MTRFNIVHAALACALAVLFADGARGGEWPDDCKGSTLPSDDSNYPDDQLILTCLPSHFDSTLIVYAHGYVRPQAALSPPAELGNASVREFIEQLLDLGFGFATSSYHKNGYAVEQAEVGLNDLVDYVEAIEPDVDAVYVTGASEGELIATMLVEKYLQTYAGGLALCGPLAGVGGSDLALALADPLEALHVIVDADIDIGACALRVAELVQDQASSFVDEIEDNFGFIGDVEDPAKSAADAVDDLGGNARDEIEDLF